MDINKPLVSHGLFKRQSIFWKQTFEEHVDRESY